MFNQCGLDAFLWTQIDAEFFSPLLSLALHLELRNTVWFPQLSCEHTDINWRQWKALSLLPPDSPHHQFSLHGYRPEWHLASRFLLSPSPRHCKYIHGIGAGRACPCVILNPCVGGLIPLTFLCLLLLRKLHSWLWSVAFVSSDPVY